MKKISKIEISNFKAYRDAITLEIADGKSMFICGENGSGKSSLFKSILYFLRNSIDQKVTLEKNIFRTDEDGSVVITFSDFDTNGARTDVPDEDLTFSSNPGDNSAKPLYIKNAARTTGFLTYADLLDVYNLKDSKKNFFNFFVLNLLGNYTNTLAGATETFAKRWNDGKNLILNARNRNSIKFKRGKKQLEGLNNEIDSILTKLFQGINRLLASYFKDMNLNVSYHLEPVAFDIDGKKKREWKITDKLTLEVSKDGKNIQDFAQILNEARLSAVAICLYFESLLLMPQDELKLILLDDIFIGLDTGNRIPILNILEKEFKDYQKIIFTYDRYWFSLAENYLKAQNDEGWIYKEMFVGERTVAGNKEYFPIVCDTYNEEERAIGYLYSTTNPDYPAAANYFRKALEGILQTYLPNNCVVKDTFETVEPYRLTTWLNEALRFVQSMSNYILDLTELINALKSLLAYLSPVIHPLSHHVPDLPTYKKELIQILENIESLKEQFKAANFKSNVRIINEKGNCLRIYLKGNPPYDFRYDIEPLYMLYVYRDNTSHFSLSKSRMRCVNMEGYGKNGKHYKHKILEESDLCPKMTYNSLDESLNKIYTHCSAIYPDANFKPLTISDVFWFDGKADTPIINLMKL